MMSGGYYSQYPPGTFEGPEALSGPVIEVESGLARGLSDIDLILHDHPYYPVIPLP